MVQTQIVLTEDCLMVPLRQALAPAAVAAVVVSMPA